MTALLVAFALAAPVVRDVYGVQVPEEVTAAGRTLRLNGTGLRKKFVFRVYVASLYLEHAPDPDPQSILRTDEVKRVEMAMLRDLDRGSIVDAVRHGFQDNSPNDMPQLTVRLIRFVSEIPDLKDGQRLSVTYVPGEGTTVVVDAGTAKTTIEGKDFADALFRVWLGDHPVDDDLKDRLLGR
jgi:Chalcone isomerase-like